MSGIYIYLFTLLDVQMTYSQSSSLSTKFISGKINGGNPAKVVIWVIIGLAYESKTAAPFINRKCSNLSLSMSSSQLKNPSITTFKSNGAMPLSVLNNSISILSFARFSFSIMAYPVFWLMSSLTSFGPNSSLTLKQSSETLTFSTLKQLFFTIIT